MTGFYQYYSQNFYWDKSTGIMVEMSFSQITQTNVSQTIMSGMITMSESSVWDRSIDRSPSSVSAERDGN
jgi:hypothetical protein